MANSNPFGATSSKLSDPDLEISHGFLNYLNAGYQGKFALLNILTQLQYSPMQTSVVDCTRESLSKINKWMGELWEGGAIINHMWKQPETFAARQALELLELLKLEVGAIGNDLVRILNNREYTSDPNQLKFLVAAIGWSAYSRDNYTRGCADYREKFDSDQLLPEFGVAVQNAESDVRVVHELLKRVRGNDVFDETFYMKLYQLAASLPGTFYTYAHDISLLLARFMENEYTFENAGVAPEVAEIWIQLGTSPAEAGYWNAHGIGPNEAVQWRMAGLLHYIAATTWKIWGYTPEAAAPWIAHNLLPTDATMWGQFGYDAEGTRYYLDKGYGSPEEVPEYMRPQSFFSSESNS